MRKMILPVLLGMCTAMAAQAAGGVTIKGTWKRKIDEKVSLYRVEHGRLEEVSVYNMADDKTFGFHFEPKQEGLYVVGTGYPGATQDKYTFWFKKTDMLQIAVNDSSYAITGEASAENKEITRWHDFILPLEIEGVYFSRHHINYEVFFPMLEAKMKEVAVYKAKNTGNKLFDASFTDMRRYDVYAYATNFLQTPRQRHPQTEELSPFYKTLKTADLTRTTALLQYPLGMRMLEAVYRTESRINGNTNPDLDTKLAAYANDTLRGEAVLEQEKYMRTYVGFEETDQKYGKYVITADQLDRRKKIAAELAKKAVKPGVKAIGFSYPDINGKKTSLSDFAGKVVLVDVWATWCGPCKAEIPSLKKMEEEMRGKDVVFMSISVDAPKDFQKWKDFVAKEELKGVQLFAGTQSDIAANYDIKGIPRFMVFNKKGEIVSMDAPRPSGAELKLLLEDELKK